MILTSMLKKRAYLLTNSNLQKNPLMFNFFHKSCKPLNDNTVNIYQEAINISNSDPNITLEDLINKGFAYIAADNSLFAWNAIECFEQARNLDIKNKYKEMIDCGINQAEKEPEGNNSKDFCFYVADHHLN